MTAETQTAVVKWTGALGFDCTMGTGETLHLDGNGEGLSPMHATLMAVGACSSVDVVEIMKKAKQDIQNCECRLTATRAETYPRIFTNIDAEYVVYGKNINAKHLARAVSLSTEKYCSVMLMLGEQVQVNTRYTINEC